MRLLVVAILGLPSYHSAVRLVVGGPQMLETDNCGMAGHSRCMSELRIAPSSVQGVIVKSVVAALCHVTFRPSDGHNPVTCMWFPPSQQTVVATSLRRAITFQIRLYIPFRTSSIHPLCQRDLLSHWPQSRSGLPLGSMIRLSRFSV